MHAPLDGVDIDALEGISAAVESGAGLPEVVRAASRALDASIVLVDSVGAVLAVAALSPADEQAVMADGTDIGVHELRVGDRPVGHLRMRFRAERPGPAMLRLVVTLVASEAERTSAPERASAAAAHSFLSALVGRELSGRAEIAARAAEIGLDLDAGASVVVARAHPLTPVSDGWRANLLAIAERGGRAVVSQAIAAPLEREGASGGEVLVLLPGGDDALASRAADAILRELEAGLSGFQFAIGRSRVATEPGEVARACDEALLAANVAEGEPTERALLAFDDTGAYRLLLSAMSEDPRELQRFYAETVEPLVAYDEQYETELVHTLVTFLESDGNVAGTAQRLFTHRHTVRYRLERVRELSGHDVGSSDGREKLSLGLKAMRVLGIAAPRGPATERGAGGGRVPRANDRDR